MRTTVPTLPPAAVIAAGCVTAENSPAAYSADELAKYMGTQEERAARLCPAIWLRGAESATRRARIPTGRS